MSRALCLIGVLLSATLSGCLWDLRDDNPPTPELTPASTRVAARVDSVGRELLAANPNLPTRPVFRSYGSPELELFHSGESELIITEGLVNRCSTDEQLKALLAAELGQMEAERQSRLGQDWRGENLSQPLPSGVPVSVTGAGDEPDFTRTAELARLEAERRETKRSRHRPEDPRTLSLRYLKNAGIGEERFKEVEPLLQRARLNRGMQLQFNGRAVDNR